MVGASQGAGEPIAQGLCLGSFAHMGGNDGLLASLERAVEIRGNNDIVGDETSRIECIAELVREIDQHEACANFLGDLLDLSKAVHRR